MSSQIVFSGIDLREGSTSIPGTLKVNSRAAWSHFYFNSACNHACNHAGSAHFGSSSAAQHPLHVDLQRTSRRGRQLQKDHFSPHGPILPTWSMWEFWASKTLQKRLSNASVTLQKRPISGLYLLLDVFIHHGRFYGQRARCCGALPASVCASAWQKRARQLQVTPDSSPTS
jgi:hypothetical protein